MICQADARHIPLADETVQCCVTSPPYWGLRDYGLATWGGGDAECDHRMDGSEQRGTMDSHSPDQPARANTTKPFRDICGKCGAIRHDAGIGLEQTPEEYVANIVQAFREVWRVLRPDGTLWLNLGDCYGSGTRASRDYSKTTKHGYWNNPAIDNRNPSPAKQLLGIPWRVAFALQADGWYLRSDIIWAKPNPMPESVTDRPTKSHEYLFLLSKQPKYFYDAEAVREPHNDRAGPVARFGDIGKNGGNAGGRLAGGDGIGREPMPLRSGGREYNPAGRNRRDVWTIPTQAYRGAHFATFPEKLVEPCILAGTSAKGNCPICGKPWERVTERNPVGKHDYEGKNLGTPPDSAGRRMLAGVRAAREAGGEHDNPFPARPTVGWRPTCDHDAEPVPAIVLDPFCGSGTVGQVCMKHGRRFVGLDLSMKYLRELALPRAQATQVAGANNDLPLFAKVMEPRD